MRFGVLADTHLYGVDPRLDRIITEYFADVDWILHAGDLVHPEVLKSLAVKPFKAVSGNMDSFEIKKSLPESLVWDERGFRIALTHGSGSPAGLETRLAAQFPEVDCIVYGHTHRGAAEWRDGIYFFNPGSATDPRFSLVKTLGILEITDCIVGDIITLA